MSIFGTPTTANGGVRLGSSMTTGDFTTSVGDLIIVYVGYSNGGAVTSFQDAAGNSYTAESSFNNSGGGQTGLFYICNGATEAKASNTVTVDLSGSPNNAICWVWDIPITGGPATFDVLGQAAASVGATLDTTGTDEFVACIGYNQTGGNFSHDTNFTLESENFQTFGGAEQATFTSAQDLTLTMGQSSADISIQGIAFKAPSSSPIAADIAGVGSVSADLIGIVDISASIAGVGSVSAETAGTGVLEADIAGVGSVVAEVGAGGSLEADIAGVGSVVAAVEGFAHISASIEGSGEVTALLSGLAQLSASIFGTSIVSVSVPSGVPIPFSQRTTAAAAVFVCIGISAPQTGQTFKPPIVASSYTTDPATLGALSLEYAALVSIYRLFGNQSINNQAQLVTLLNWAQAWIYALYTTLLTITPPEVDPDLFENLVLLVSNAVQTMFNITGLSPSVPPPPVTGAIFSLQ